MEKEARATIFHPSHDLSSIRSFCFDSQRRLRPLSLARAPLFNFVRLFSLSTQADHFSFPNSFSKQINLPFLFSSCLHLFLLLLWFLCPFFPLSLPRSFIPQFLDAPPHLYKRVCPSVRPSVRPSFGPSVRRSVTPSLRRLLVASYAEYSALFPSFVTQMGAFYVLETVIEEKEAKRPTKVPCVHRVALKTIEKIV